MEVLEQESNLDPEFSTKQEIRFVDTVNFLSAETYFNIFA